MTPPSEGVTIVVIPQPTVNGPLHIGHLSGPYLGADIAARAAKARGERVIAFSGLDVHPNYVLTKAELLGVDPYQMIADYRAKILAAYRAARIEYDTFLDPQDPAFQRAAASMLRELVENGTVPMRETTLQQCAGCERTLHHSYVIGTCATCGDEAGGLSCEGCGKLTSIDYLVDPSCARCGGRPRPMVVTVPVLPMEDYRPRLAAEWLHAEWPRPVRAIIQQYQRERLPDYPLAYPTNWGIELDGPLAGLRLDFPAELGFSYLYAAAAVLSPEADTLAGRVAALADLAGIWQFNGVDNSFYFGALYPAIFAAAGVPTPKVLGATVNELYLLEGEKFSTSRNHAVWAIEFLAREDPELVRLYLSWDRPDRYESDFTHAAYRAFCDWARPLLDGKPTAGGPPTELAAAELARADQALRLSWFDSALAARCLLAALSAGAGADSPALAALTGRPFPPDAG